MVKWWEIQREKGIALSKYRIKHHEKHGNGIPAVQDKENLKKQERHHELRKNK